jgi:predicted Zn-ribbon and HTH transcriptional regulator
MIGQKKAFLCGTIELIAEEEPLEIKEARAEIVRLKKRGGTLRDLQILSERIRKYGYRLHMTM